MNEMILVHSFHITQSAKLRYISDIPQVLFLKLSHVAELVSSHAQSAWRSKGKRVQVAELAAYCNYFLKKKIKPYDYLSKDTLPS